jgi:hypothetical protein
MRALWEALLADERFVARVKAGNCIRYDGEAPNPEKSTITEADAPECTIEPAGGTGDLKPTKGTLLFCTQRFRIRLAGSESRVQKELLPLKWIVISTLAKVGPTLGLPFVNRCALAETTEAAVDAALKERGLDGWTASIVVAVDLAIDTVAL